MIFTAPSRFEPTRSALTLREILEIAGAAILSMTILLALPCMVMGAAIYIFG